MPRNCVYYKKMRKKGYTRCLRDNSIRNGACPCPFYEMKFLCKIKEKIEDKFFDWLWRIKYVRK